jgi:hypothetical protein
MTIRAFQLNHFANWICNQSDGYLSSCVDLGLTWDWNSIPNLLSYFSYSQLPIKILNATYLSWKRIALLDVKIETVWCIAFIDVQWIECKVIWNIWLLTTFNTFNAYINLPSLQDFDFVYRIVVPCLYFFVILNKLPFKVNSSSCKSTWNGREYDYCEVKDLTYIKNS